VTEMRHFSFEKWRRFSHQVSCSVSFNWH